jgi:PAS domain S-box-containing protein
VSAAPPQATAGGRWRRIGSLARSFPHGSTTLLLLLVLIAALLGLVNWRYYEVNRDNDELFARRATERANAIASQLRDTIAATLLQADTMHGMARLVTEARLSGNSAAETALRPYLDPATGHGGPDFAQVSAIGASGGLLWSSLDWTPSSHDLSEREYFTALVTNPAFDSYIGRPVLERTSGVWSVQYARPLRDSAGALRAVTVVSLRAGMLARLCRDLALAPDDAVTLLRDDGMVLMRRDMTHLGDTAGTAPTGEREPTETNALSARPSPLDAVPRYTAFRRILGTPLTLYVGLSREAQMQALAEVRATLWRGSLFLDGAIVALAVTGGFALLLLRRSDAYAARAASLAATEAWFRAVIDETADGVLVFDNVGTGDVRIGFANRQAGEIFGVSAGQLVGRDFLTLVYPDDRAWVAARKRSAVHVRKLDKVTYRALRPDGSLVWIKASSVVLPNPIEPNHWRMIATMRDITDEHAHEQALAEARTRIERILNVIPGVFYQLTAQPGGPFIPKFVSESVRDMFGITAEEAARPGFLVSRVAVDLAATRQAALDKAGPSGIAVAEYPARLPGGELWLRDTMRRLARPDGGAELVGFIADATADHLAAEAQRAAEAELQRLNQALAAYSHSLFALIRSSGLDELATRVCEGIVEEPVYILACVGLPESSPGLPVRLLAGAGNAIGYLKELKLSWSADVPEGHGPTGIALREGRAHVSQDSLNDPVYAPWRKLGTRFGFRSALSVPCKADDQTLGVLMVYASEPHAFGPKVLGLFERLSDEIGFAIKLENVRAQLRAAEAGRAAAEANLRDAAQLGPGVLYRARVHAAGVEVLHMFGDASHLTGAFAAGAFGPATLGTVLGRPDTSAAIHALADESTRSDDIPLEAGNGTTSWLRNAVRVTGRSDGAVDVVGYISEVTQEKEQQLHRQQVTTLLTLGEMATGMAHELNQPLTSISFAAQNARVLLGREPADLRAVGGKVEKIIGEARRAARLIDHMRVFAHNERGEIRPISCYAVLESALEILDHRLRGFQVVKDVPQDLPAVAGAPVGLEQVLINLIANAADAYEAAAPDVARVVTVKGEVQEDKVVLRVTDRAGGIPLPALSRVFEPFFTTKGPGKGTGLGLGLAFGTIAKMGGTITAANEDGGAVFEIRLPMATGPAGSGLPAPDWLTPPWSGRVPA